VVKAGFSQRRKTLANSLSSVMGIPKEKVYSALKSQGLPEAARIEQLNMDKLIAVSAELMKQ
jgi:16S rRNA (adenine1518-N6/adenine1519-N6)-dimethyltransferase